MKKREFGKMDVSIEAVMSGAHLKSLEPSPAPRSITVTYSSPAMQDIHDKFTRERRRGKSAKSGRNPHGCFPALTKSKTKTALDETDPKMRMSMTRRRFREPPCNLMQTHKRILGNGTSNLVKATKSMSELGSAFKSAGLASVAKEEKESLLVGNNKDAYPFFITKSLTDSPIRFLHFTPEDAGRTAFLPYDLVAANARQLEDHGDEMVHYSMSRQGLVHIEPLPRTEHPGRAIGRPVGQFISQAEWMTSATHYNQVSNLGVFKHYLVRKCLWGWRNFVRYKLYCEVRERLHRKIFLGQDSFCPPLLQIKHLITDMDGVVLLEGRPPLDAFHAKAQQLAKLKAQRAKRAGVINSEEDGSTFAPRPCKISDYVDHQDKVRKTANAILEEKVDAIQCIVETVLKTVEGKKNSTYAKPLTLLQDFEKFGASAREMSRTKSMYRERLDGIDLVRRRELADHHLGMLLSFIRLVDYIVVECLVALGITNFSQLLHELHRADHTKTGMFLTSFSFVEPGMAGAVDENENKLSAGSFAFSPDGDEIGAMMQQQVSNSVEVIRFVSRIAFIQEEPYSSQLKEEVTDNVNATTILRESAQFQGIMGEVEGKVELDFERAMGYVNRFASVRPVYDARKTWNLKTFTDHKEQLLANPSGKLKTLGAVVRDFEKDLTRSDKRSYEVERMASTGNVGILQIASRSLRRELIEDHQEKAEAMKKLLRTLSRKRCLQQLEKYRSGLLLMSRMTAPTTDVLDLRRQLTGTAPTRRESQLAKAMSFGKNKGTMALLSAGSASSAGSAGSAGSNTDMGRVGSAGGEGDETAAGKKSEMHEDTEGEDVDGGASRRQSRMDSSRKGSMIDRVADVDTLTYQLELVFKEIMAVDGLYVTSSSFRSLPISPLPSVLLC
jgi:hypothetical protein